MVGTSEKQSFRGFEQTRSSAASDIESVLGIRIDPKIRTFEFKPNERLGRLERLRRIVAKSAHEKPFLENQVSEDTVMRGVFMAEHKALLVRPGDMFAQYHELGHSYVQGQNPELLGEIVNIKKSGGDASFAQYAFDEGVAQWVAINTDLGQQDEARHKEGVREHNRLVGKSAEEPQLDYDAQTVLKKLEAVREAIKTCIGNPLVKRRSNWEAIGEIYTYALVKVKRESLAIGYVYMEALMRTYMEQPGFSKAQALALVAMRPPSSLGQIEQEIKAFKGFN